MNGRNYPNPAIWLVPWGGGFLRSCPLTQAEFLRDELCNGAPTPKHFFRQNESLHLFETHCRPFFLFLTKSCHFIGLQICEKTSMFFSWPSQKGSGLIPDLTSQSDLRSINFFINMRAKYNRRPFWPCCSAGWATVIKIQGRGFESRPWPMTHASGSVFLRRCLWVHFSS